MKKEESNFILKELKRLMEIYGNSDPMGLLISDVEQGNGFMCGNILFYISEDSTINLSFSVKCPTHIVAKFMNELKDFDSDLPLYILEPFCLSESGDLTFGKDAQSVFYNHLKGVFIEEYEKEKELFSGFTYIHHTEGNC